jgi:hypothetical protein
VPHGTSVYMVSSEGPAPTSQWDSNRRRKDHQIFALDTLTTAPCTHATELNHLFIITSHKGSVVNSKASKILLLQWLTPNHYIKYLQQTFLPLSVLILDYTELGILYLCLLSNKRGMFLCTCMLVSRWTTLCSPSISRMTHLIELNFHTRVMK